jgi:hypothetical protein
MPRDGALDADRAIASPRRPAKGAGRQVLLAADDLKLRKAGKVQAWAESHAHAVELFYLPSCAPDRARPARAPPRQRTA